MHTHYQQHLIEVFNVINLMGTEKEIAVVRQRVAKALTNSLMSVVPVAFDVATGKLTQDPDKTVEIKYLTNAELMELDPENVYTKEK